MRNLYEELNENLKEISRDHLEKTEELEYEKTRQQIAVSKVEDQSRKVEMIMNDSEKEFEETKHKLQTVERKLLEKAAETEDLAEELNESSREY